MPGELERNYLQVERGLTARLFEKPSAEQRWLARILPGVFAPDPAARGPWVRAFEAFAVIPSVHYTNFSLHFQR